MDDRFADWLEDLRTFRDEMPTRLHDKLELALIASTEASEEVDGDRDFDVDVARTLRDTVELLGQVIDSMSELGRALGFEVGALAAKLVDLAELVEDRFE